MYPVGVGATRFGERNLCARVAVCYGVQDRFWYFEFALG